MIFDEAEDWIRREKLAMRLTFLMGRLKHTKHKPNVMKKLLLLILIAFLLIDCSPVVNTNRVNYAVINPKSGEEEVIRLAAQITPSERQLCWQRLGIYCLCCFWDEYVYRPGVGRRE